MPLAFEIGNRLFDDAQVIFEGGQQDFGDMQRPCLAEDGADRRVRIEQGLDVGIIFRAALDPAGGTEGCDQGILPFQVAGTLEEFNIFWVRAGPAAFDEGTPRLSSLCAMRILSLLESVKPSDWVPSRRVVS